MNLCHINQVGPVFSNTVYVSYQSTDGRGGLSCCYLLCAADALSVSDSYVSCFLRHTMVTLLTNNHASEFRYSEPLGAEIVKTLSENCQLFQRMKPFSFRGHPFHLLTSKSAVQVRGTASKHVPKMYMHYRS